MNERQQAMVDLMSNIEGFYKNPNNTQEKSNEIKIRSVWTLLHTLVRGDSEFSQWDDLAVAVRDYLLPF